MESRIIDTLYLRGYLNPVAARVLRAHCAWKEPASLQAGHMRMLEDWRTIYCAFPAHQAGTPKVRKVLHQIPSMF